MPLTPQDVHSKVFGPTRFRRGYDEAEVDAFLDEVEAELTRLHREIDTLRAQVGGSAGDAAAAPVAGEDAGNRGDDGTAVDAGPDVTADGADRADGDGTGSPAGAPPFAASAPTQSVPFSAGPPVAPQREEGLEQQVARALVLAQRAADEAVRDAEQQAEQLRRSATSEAERIRLEAAEQAEQERRRLEETRSQAEDDVEQLRAFEREYRNRLRAYLEHQLRELGDAGVQVEGRRPESLTGATAGAGAPVGLHPSSELPTSDLPADDPAVVPPVAPLADSPAVPPSVPVSDYSSSSGVGNSASGDELRHERRDLHDGL